MLPTVCNMIANVLDALQVVQNMPLTILLMIDSLLLVALFDSLTQYLQEASIESRLCAFATVLLCSLHQIGAGHTALRLYLSF